MREMFILVIRVDVFVIEFTRRIFRVILKCGFFKQTLVMVDIPLCFNIVNIDTKWSDVGNLLE